MFASSAILRRDFVADLGLGVVAPPGGMQIAAGEDRTPVLRIMRPTRCQLRYCRMYWFTVALLVSSPSCVIVVSLRRLRFSALRKYGAKHSPLFSAPGCETCARRGGANFVGGMGVHDKF